MKKITGQVIEASQRIAEASDSANGYKIMMQLRTFLWERLEDGSKVSRQNATEVCGKKKKIGIWVAKEEAGEGTYVRQAGPFENFGDWANVREIKPKRTGRRIVLLGESVGRGFYYDPYLSPAKYLQTMLRRDVTDEEVEVIDLARSNILMEQLKGLALAALDLKPDVVVLMAGNNWSPLLSLGPSDFVEAARCVRDGKWESAAKYLEDVLRRTVDVFLDELEELSIKYKFGLVIAIPEFNLLDWETEFRFPPLVSRESLVDWIALRAEAIVAVANGDFARAEKIGFELLKIDKGTASVGYKLIGECRLRVGDLVLARANLEAARDCAISRFGGFDSPRCFAVVQRAMRTRKRSSWLEVVDIPELFKGYLNGGLPDRRMFLDYCHFTAEAMSVAMEAVSNRVFGLLYGPKRVVPAVEGHGVQLDRKAEAEAHFLAAVHNGNWGQSPELIRYHIGKALDLHPSLVELIRAFFLVSVRRAPTALCNEFDKICDCENPTVIHFLFHPAQLQEEKILNRTLLEGMADELRRRGFLDMEASGWKLLTKEHAMQNGEVNLLKGSYSMHSNMERLEGERLAYYRSYCERSSFTLVFAGSRKVRFELVLRSRMGDSEAAAVVVNDVVVERFSVAKTWIRKEIEFSADILKLGLNSVDVLWPMPCWDFEAWCEELGGHLEAGRAVTLAPVFGEIQGFRVIYSG